MAKGSPHFARIKKDVLTIVAAIPAGRLVSYKDIGEWLDVMPRHVAYILALLDPVDRAHLPWQRAVKESDAGLAQNRIAISALEIDLPRQKRPQTQ
jgi:alkylated DNA nucleotide flippase Atl1